MTSIFISYKKLQMDTFDCDTNFFTIGFRKKINYNSTISQVTGIKKIRVFEHSRITCRRISQGNFNSVVSYF